MASVSIPFMRGIREGNVEDVRRLLDHHPHLVNAMGLRGDSLPPLLEASRYGQADVVRLLLDRGAHIDAVDSTGWTALFFACHYAHEDVVRLLIRRGADARIKTQSGWNALMRAASYGRVGTVRTLVHFGNQDVNAKAGMDETALWVAARDGHLEVVKVLLFEAGADPHIPPRYQRAVNEAGATAAVRTCVEYIEWFASELERPYYLAKARRVVNERRAISRAPILAGAITATAIQRNRWLVSTTLTRGRVERGEELPLVEMRGGSGGGGGGDGGEDSKRRGREGPERVLKDVLLHTLGVMNEETFDALMGMMRIK